jgi:hypothetical protein
MSYRIEYYMIRFKMLKMSKAYITIRQNIRHDTLQYNKGAQAPEGVIQEVNHNVSGISCLKLFKYVFPFLQFYSELDPCLNI